MTDSEWLAQRIMDRIERDGAVHFSSLVEEIGIKRPRAVTSYPNVVSAVDQSMHVALFDQDHPLSPVEDVTPRESIMDQARLIIARIDQERHQERLAENERMHEGQMQNAIERHRRAMDPEYDRRRQAALAHGPKMLLQRFA